MADKETDAEKKASGSSSAKSAKSSAAPSNGEQKPKSSGKSSKAAPKPAATGAKGGSKSSKSTPETPPASESAAAATATQAPPATSEQPSNTAESNGPSNAPPETHIQQQRTSMILRAVLDEEETPPDVQAKRFRYHMYMDVALGIGLLVAMAGFTIGLFKMYVTHKAQQCIMECDYPAAIALLKGNPLPPVFSINGNDRNEDPEELLARALYLDAMHKLDEENDTKGGLDELQQIRAGTHYFSEAQRILADNFEPSGTTLTGGVVENRATPPASNK